MRNPILNRAVFVFSLLGIFVAGYLWYMHGHAGDIPCGPSHGCEIVALSRYSRFPFGYGPPVAEYGTCGYAAIAVLAFLRTLNEDRRRDYQLLGLIALGTLFGSAASLYLTYLEKVTIGAFCRWCVASQIIILILCALSLTDCWISSIAAGARSRRKGVSH